MNKWRLLEFTIDNGAWQMALDEAIMIANQKKKVPNTIRFYQIKPKIVTIGCNQEINLNKKFVRRLTGGSAVFHNEDLVYGAIFKEDNHCNSIIKSYHFIGDCLIKGFLEVGIKADYSGKNYQKKSDNCFLNENPYDLVVDGKKISGNALAQINGVFLQQGSVNIEKNLFEKFIIGFKKGLGIQKIDLEKGVLTDYEKDLAFDLYEKKYNKRI